MAVSWASLAAYEESRLALDKPLIATQSIPLSPSVVRWTNVGATTDPDRTDSTYPARRAYDGFPGFKTTPDGTAANTWYLSFDLAAAGVEFDCAFIEGHNFGTLSLTTVQLQVADNAAFSTNLRTVADFGSPADDGRLADLELYHTGSDALRYSAVQHARLKLARAANFTPELGELILGRRRQLEYKPSRPYDEYSLAESAELSDTVGGLWHKTNYHRGGRELSGELLITDDTYRDDVRAFFRACRGPFVWVENPSSAPASFNLMMRDGGLSIPRVAANVRRYSIAAVEQGPEEYFLDTEENT